MKVEVEEMIMNACGVRESMDEEDSRGDPNDTAYKPWSCASGFVKLCRYLPPQFTVFLGKPVIRTSWMAETAPHKSG